jgi:hypothetical protein
VLREDGAFLSAKVPADYRDDPYIGKETRRNRKVRRRAAQHFFSFAERRFDRIERN